MYLGGWYTEAVAEYTLNEYSADCNGHTSVFAQWCMQSMTYTNSDLVNQLRDITRKGNVPFLILTLN